MPPRAFAPTLLALAACLFASDALAAQTSPYATRVVSTVLGGGLGVFGPSAALGGPRATAGTEVYTLGEGGSLTLGFAPGVAITDGPGTDFIVFENGFEFPALSGKIFAEVGYVEVSSNGVDFARFPTSYDGINAMLGSFATLKQGTYLGFAGAAPVLADIVANTLDPTDPTAAGGDGFDLSDLASDPLVISGLVDLSSITEVRIVDVRAGVDTDSFGRLVYDSGGPVSSIDIDALAIVNMAGVAPAAPGAPTVDLSLDSFGRLIIDLDHPGGLNTLDFTNSVFAYDYRGLDFGVLLPILTPSPLFPSGLRLTSSLPIDGVGARGILSFTVRDSFGNRTTDQVIFQR